MEIHTHELQVQIQELKGELVTLRKASNKVSQTTYMDNRLKVIKELFLDNALLKVQN
jgi:ribosomal protein L29